MSHPENRVLLPAYLHHPRPRLHRVTTWIEDFYNRRRNHTSLGGKSPSNTNDTKRPGQQPHKQTVNNLRTDPACSPLDKQDRRPSTEHSCNHRHHCRAGTEHSCNRWHHCRSTTPHFSHFSLNRGVTGFKDGTQPTNRGVIGCRSRLQTAKMARYPHPHEPRRQIPIEYELHQVPWTTAA